MEINEKLDIFYRASIDAADTKSREMLEEQKRIYGEMLAEYEQRKKEEQRARVRAAEAKVRREINRAASGAMMGEKMRCHARQEEWKAALFEEVEARIQKFRETEEYGQLLIKKIKEAQAFAKGGELTVYLDAEDAPFMERVKSETGCTPVLSEESFGGGIRAVIPSKNMLLEESFSEKLRKEREGFSF